MKFQHEPGIDKKYTYNPKPTNAFEGGSARFWCDIAAKPSPKIQWIKDNSYLNPLTLYNDRFTILPSGILQILPVEANDAGLYWCNSRFNLELDKFAEYETSEKARLTVYKDATPRPPKILAGPKDVDVEVGKSAILECFVDGNPLPKVEWRKKDVDGTYKDGQSFGHIYGHSNLHIPAVSLEHDGVYECVVGPSGSENVSSATLNVLVPPELFEDTPSYKLHVARSKSISCPVKGKPEPKIAWFYNGKPIDNLQGSSNLKIMDNGHRLILYSIRNTDSGYYQCVASNKAGVAISITRIMLENKGNAPGTPRNVTAISTSSSSIRVSVKFAPGTEYSLIQYQVQGEDVKQIVFNLKGTDLSEAYETEIRDLKPYTNYSVEIRGLTQKDGVSDYSDKIYVQTKEDVPLAAPSLSLTNPNYHTILVSWSPLTFEQSRGKVVTYRIFYKAEDALEVLEDVPADQTSFYIRDVEPETTYFIQVLAATGAGFPPRNSAEAMKHITPAVNASSPPRLTLKYINDTAVKISWQSPGSFSTEDKVIGFNFNITNLSDDNGNVPLKHFNVNSSVHWKYVTDLNPYDEFEVTLVAVMKSSFSGTSSRKFQLATLKMQPEPWHFSVADITAQNISLVWTPVISGKVEYEVCYSKVEQTLPPICHKTYETSWIVENLDPYTRYLFKARASLPNGKEHFSKNLIVMTREDRPSPPVMVTVEVLKPKVVRLQWRPPVFRNGELKSYIIKYTNIKGSIEETQWTSITQKANSNSAVIGDLKPGRYLFTVFAVNSIGLSNPSQNVSAIPFCLEELSCEIGSIPDTSNTGEIPWSKKASLPAKAIWIIAAFISFIVLVVITVIIFCYKRRRSQQHMDTSLNSSHTPFFPGNGHVSSGMPTNNFRPWNGHAGSSHNVGYGPGDVISPQEFAPMLNQIRENTNLDSKGCSDAVKINGLYPNGLIRANKLTTPCENLAGKQKDNGQDYGNIMSAVIVGNGMRKDKVDPRVRDVEEISMSRLDSIDKEDHGGVNEENIDRDQFIDHSSEDSGTECRHAGVLGSREDAFHAQSPASSPGESSLDHQLAWEHKSSPADEIVSHFNHTTSGAVIGQVVSLRDSSRNTSEYAEDVSGLQPGRLNFDDDESASNDRDSGHGGEIKAQQIGATNMCDSGHAELMSDVDTPHASIPGDIHSSIHYCSSSPATSTASSPPSLSQSSQQQLPHSSSRSSITPSAVSHQQQTNQSRPHLRNLRQRHIDLPLPSPPPSPPPHNSVPTNATSETVAVQASEAVSCPNNRAEGKGEGEANGSSDHRQSQAKLDIGFSPPRPSPSPPNIA
ncbi:protogenin [Elysia marginata]|uniref:Protogenin n=1 Tax=Elysia marginata TaxID=1093978 RepID=A0AAV4GNI2_9GAST|nr:protogenin [Elysia marginata]